MSAISDTWQNIRSIEHFRNIDYSVDLNLILFVFIVIASFLASLRSVVRLREKSINLRHNLAIVNYLFIISFAAFVVSTDVYSIMLLVVPGVLILTSYLGNVKHRKIFDLASIVFVLLALINQYAPIFYSIVQ